MIPIAVQKYRPRGATVAEQNKHLAEMMIRVDANQYERQLVHDVQAASLKVFLDAGLSLDQFRAFRLFERSIQTDPHPQDPPVDDSEGGKDFLATYPAKMARMTADAIGAAKGGKAAMFALWRAWFPNHPVASWQVELGTVEPFPIN